MRTICLALTLTLIVLVAGCATGQDSSEAPADGAKITFTSNAEAAFWTSTSDKECAGFHGAGRVKDNEPRTMAVQPGVPIQVRGQGNSGLFFTSFVPEKGHSYQVNFVSGDSPSQNVTDVTDPAHPVAVGSPVCQQQTKAYDQKLGEKKEAEMEKQKKKKEVEMEKQKEAAWEKHVAENPADGVKITLTSSGFSSGIVAFWISTSDTAGTGFRWVGNVVVGNVSVLDTPDFLVNKLLQIFWGTSRTVVVQPGVPIQIRGYVSCGSSVVTPFVPEKGHTYQVTHSYGNEDFTQNVMDITVPDHPVSVAYNAEVDRHLCNTDGLYYHGTTKGWLPHP